MEYRLLAWALSSSLHCWAWLWWPGSNASNDLLYFSFCTLWLTWVSSYEKSWLFLGSVSSFGFTAKRSRALHVEFAHIVSCIFFFLFYLCSECAPLLTCQNCVSFPLLILSFPLWFELLSLSSLLLLLFWCSSCVEPVFCNAVHCNSSLTAVTFHYIS